MFFFSLNFSNCVLASIFWTITRTWKKQPKCFGQYPFIQKISKKKSCLRCGCPAWDKPRKHFSIPSGRLEARLMSRFFWKFSVKLVRLGEPRNLLTKACERLETWTLIQTKNNWNFPQQTMEWCSSCLVNSENKKKGNFLDSNKGKWILLFHFFQKVQRRSAWCSRKFQQYNYRLLACHPEESLEQFPSGIEKSHQ